LRRIAVLAGILVSLAASPSFARAADVPVVGTTTSVTCSFDPHGAPGITSCSQLSIRITGGTCHPAGELATGPTRLFFHDEFYSSRQYSGDAVLNGLNGTTVTGAFGDVPLDDFAAWDDAIYRQVIRPHARLLANSGVTESRLNSYAVIVDDASCA
jgi:hypothetical protein